jgi:hypothetical protein
MNNEKDEHIEHRPVRHKKTSIKTDPSVPSSNKMDPGNDKEEEVSGGAVVNQKVEAEDSSVAREPSRHTVNATMGEQNHDDDDDRGHGKSSLQDQGGNDDNPDADDDEDEEEKERINTSRLYGYEDADQSIHGTTNQQRMTRRNVVTAEVVRYEMSYHPGRVVSIVFQSIPSVYPSHLLSRSG